ncbi:MAG: DUF4258 domain-containing protein [Devosia sp.]
MAAEIFPLSLSGPAALKKIKELAADSGNIVIISHTAKRQKQRNITRLQIERCVQAGYIDEGPFMNDKGNWQVTMCHYSAGEEVTAVVAIDWPNKLIVITTY